MITEQEIEIAERFFETLDADSSRAFFEKFSEMQPFIFVYVMAMSENLQSEGAQYDTLYLTGVIFKAFETHYDMIREISAQEIDLTEQEIIAQYEALALAGEEGNKEGAESIIKETSQPHILEYIGTAIGSVEDEYIEEDQSLAFNILQTVVECFHKSAKSSGKMHIVK